MAGAKRTLVLLPAMTVWLVSLFMAQQTDVAAAGAAESPHKGIVSMFTPSSECMACHNSLTAPDGDDISIGLNWRSSMMANASRDPYWHAGVRRETLDHPMKADDIQDECATCHMPMARAEAHAEGRKESLFTHLPIGSGAGDNPVLAADGVSCTLCHQITSERFGTRESFVGQFVLNMPKPGEPRTMFGPFEIKDGRKALMRSVVSVQPDQGKHIQQSELCATCHTLITEALGPNGESIGSIPEQVPFQEWQHSAYRDQRSCQSCHMPEVDGKTRIASVTGEEREGMHRHTFLGGNFFLIRMLNRYRNELGVSALSSEMDATASGIVRQLGTDTAEVTIGRQTLTGGEMAFDVRVRNLTGHKLPTGYPSRRVWLHVTVRDAQGRVLFESGAIDSRGAIAGNDFDADPRRFEPHYSEIRRPDEVQIYESVMGDPRNVPTTGLLQATSFLKDNRLLPDGFDKTSATPDIAVHGEAAHDADFTGGGDRVRYVIDTQGAAGPFTVDAELRYQVVSFRWADNLRAYDAPEPRRFVSYYDAMSSGASTVLAHTEQIVDRAAPSETAAR